MCVMWYSGKNYDLSLAASGGNGTVKIWIFGFFIEILKEADTFESLHLVYTIVPEGSVLNYGRYAAYDAILCNGVLSTLNFNNLSYVIIKCESMSHIVSQIRWVVSALGLHLRASYVKGLKCDI